MGSQDLDTVVRITHVYFRRGPHNPMFTGTTTNHGPIHHSGIIVQVLKVGDWTLNSFYLIVGILINTDRWMKSSDHLLRLLVYSHYLQGLQLHPWWLARISEPSTDRYIWMFPKIVVSPNHPF